MHTKINPIELGCPLIQHLEDLGERRGGADASFGGAFLACLGRFQKIPSHPDIDGVRALLEAQSAGKHASRVSELQDLCSPCKFASTCLVGDLVLNK